MRTIRPYPLRNRNRSHVLHIQVPPGPPTNLLCGYGLTLSPTPQYRICRVFLSTNKTKNSQLVGVLIIFAYRSVEELLEEMQFSRILLIEHSSNINARHSAIGLHLCSFQLGYLLTVSTKLVQRMRQYENEMGKPFGCEKILWKDVARRADA